MKTPLLPTSATLEFKIQHEIVVRCFGPEKRLVVGNQASPSVLRLQGQDAVRLVRPVTRRLPAGQIFAVEQRHETLVALVGTFLGAGHGMKRVNSRQPMPMTAIGRR